MKENFGCRKSKVYTFTKELDHVSGPLRMRVLLKANTGIITAYYFEKGETAHPGILPFETFIQVLSGQTEITIEGDTHSLEQGQFIIIPRHAKNSIHASSGLQFLSVVIKSGYEEMT